MGNTAKPQDAPETNKRKKTESSDSDNEGNVELDRKPTGRVLVKNCHIWRWTNDGLTLSDETGERNINGAISQRMWFCVDHSGRISQMSGTDPVPDEKLFDAVIDAGGRLVLPGLMDSHIHVMLLGESAYFLDLGECNSIAAMKEALKAHAAKNPNLPWIVGTNWDQTDLSRYPTRHDIDEVVPDIPVFLWRACWHIGVANSAALRTVNIDISQMKFDILGGSVDVDERGPTGVLRENAVQLLSKAIVETRTDEDKKRFLREGLNICLRNGLTAVQTNDEGTVQAYMELLSQQKIDMGQADEESVPVRVFLTPNYVEINEEDNALQQVGPLKPGVHTLLPAQDLPLLSAEDMDSMGDLSTVRSFFCIDRVKLFTDGSLGAETAALNIVNGVSVEAEHKDLLQEPGNILSWAVEDVRGTEQDGADVAAACDTKDYQGILLHQTNALTSMVRTAREKGYRLEIHCIGDRAAEQTLTALENAGAVASERHVMTHCQVLSPSLIVRMKAIGAIANVQPSFVPTDMRWVLDRLSPEQIEHSYCWKTLLEEGIWVAGGSDAPIEACSPFTGMYDAIFRLDRNSCSDDENAAEDVFRPCEKLSFAQALWIYTVGAAYACKCETVLGQLKETFAGDFVVVDPAVLDNHSLLKSLTPDIVVVGGILKHACDGICDGEGKWKGLQVYFPRFLAGEVDGDEIHEAATRRRPKRNRRAPTKLGGDFVPGKNGPAGLLSRRNERHASAAVQLAPQDKPTVGVRAMGSAPANGFFCACWLRGRMCAQPRDLRSEHTGGDAVEASKQVYCMPESAQKYHLK